MNRLRIFGEIVEKEKLNENENQYNFDNFLKATQFYDKAIIFIDVLELLINNLKYSNIKFIDGFRSSELNEPDNSNEFDYIGISILEDEKNIKKIVNSLKTNLNKELISKIKININDNNIYIELKINK